MFIERKIRKIGNSLGVLLPSDVMKLMQLDEDSIVKISVVDNKIVLEKSNS